MHQHMRVGMAGRARVGARMARQQRAAGAVVVEALDAAAFSTLSALSQIKGAPCFFFMSCTSFSVLLANHFATIYLNPAIYSLSVLTIKLKRRRLVSGTSSLLVENGICRCHLPGHQL